MVRRTCLYATPEFHSSTVGECAVIRDVGKTRWKGACNSQVMESVVTRGVIK